VATTAVRPFISVSDLVQVSMSASSNVMSNGEPAAIFGPVGRLRPRAEELVQWLTQWRVDVYVLSRDEPSIIKLVTTQLGIQTNHAVGGCTPEPRPHDRRKPSNALDPVDLSWTGPSSQTPPALAAQSLKLSWRVRTSWKTFSSPSTTSLSPRYYDSRSCFVNIYSTPSYPLYLCVHPFMFSFVVLTRGC